RHLRAVRGDDDEMQLAASIAHQDRERLLGAVEQLLPVLDAARLVARLVQRGSLPLAARRALLELHVALEEVDAPERVRDQVLADALAASLDGADDVDDADGDEAGRGSTGVRPGLARGWCGGEQDEDEVVVPERLSA